MTFTAFLLVSIIGSFLQNVMTIALPVIMREFSIAATVGQWLTTGYLLTLSIMILSSAFLIRRFPARKLFFSALALSISGALLCAVAPSFPLLLAGRILQAAGGGMILPLTQVSILTIYPAEKHGAMMGVYGLAVSVAPMVAPALGGIIIDLFGWRMIFWGAIVLLGMNFMLALPTMKNIMDTQRHSLDILSLLLCSIGLSGLLLGLGNVGSSKFWGPQVAVPLSVGILALAIFCRRQFRSESPFLELRVFRDKRYRCSVAIDMLLYAITTSSATLLPIYFQSVGGLSATISGLIMLPASIANAVVNPLAGKLYDKFGIKRLAVCGSMMMVVSCLGLTLVGAQVSTIFVAVFYVMRLMASGMLLMPAKTWGMSNLRTESVVHGTSILTSLGMTGGAIGSAILVAVMTYVSTRTNQEAGTSVNVAGINAAFIGMAMVSFVLLAVCLLWVERNNPGHELQCGGVERVQSDAYKGGETL